MTRLILIAGLVFGLTVLPLMGMTVKPDNSGEISDTTQDKIDAIKDCVKSNDWDGVRKVYRDIDLRDGDAMGILKAVAKEVPKNKDTKGLRREIKTKYKLLNDSTNEIAELKDVASYAMSILNIQSMNIPTLDVSYLSFSDFNSLLLNVDVLRVGVINVPFVVIDNKQFIQAMTAWESRWEITIDAVGVHGVRVVPYPATVLGRRRTALMLALEENGWTEETETMWTKYHQGLAAALTRRNLHKRR